MLEPDISAHCFLSKYTILSLEDFSLISSCSNIADELIGLQLANYRPNPACGPFCKATEPRMVFIHLKIVNPHRASYSTETEGTIKLKIVII